MKMRSLYILVIVLLLASLAFLGILLQNDIRYFHSNSTNEALLAPATYPVTNPNTWTMQIVDYIKHSDTTNITCSDSTKCSANSVNTSGSATEETNSSVTT